jgi:alkaline phosphatase
MALLALQGCAVREQPGAKARGSSDRRNVILFLGDGMGVSTVTAARIYAGQLQGGSGEEHQLPFDRFPHVALVKTYNTDAQVSDSAGTMTAIMAGERTRIGYVNVAATVERGDCAGALAHPLPTLLQIAEDRGRASGIISTTRITHATPAATYAHVPDRDWESDAQLSPDAAAAGCRDIARQLVEFDHGDGIDIILGGGRVPFLPESARDPEYTDVAGARRDGRHLIDEWQARAAGRRYVWNADQFAALSPENDGQVLGLFEPSHMQYDADRAGDRAGEPSLAEMTRFAIGKLQRAPNGFFLMVEGGRIDHGHHGGNAYRALSDTVAMADAVAVAVALTDPRETLIVVTADHSHTLTISGYPKRGNPILGLVETPAGHLARDLEGRPYTTLGYANGPGHHPTLPDLGTVDIETIDFKQPAAIPLPSETHAGEDVAAFAHGRGAERVHGVMEQHRLFHVMYDALFADDR